jgi:hypothetical protein
MTKTELKELMEYLSAIDNRQLTTEKLQVWFDLVGYLDFDLAKNAVIEAQRDETLNYVEAKHIESKNKNAPNKFEEQVTPKKK